ncbi:CD74 molecule, major histocompatibility complex, class II invariant chain b [Notolabrus celidotus]|uniref:CD74 molecule, major histocompatibility complex, class II invariant chain b n=1 Tax=Notolabrus celidotus TaxID=1203425 RepID=UPI00149053CF|nr:CD74 molecule, major histocompatibility complex, class II invariant chain b [Notolabrus celidotus]XP_034537437.1 CD74 molecule, major histocompatibility complex, class II invariant chain b [Notolabrus celidotus]XP_034537439.1 CD74 molecule, major histocompatibility complex, class II invariant chain b [Notolabrus celidotus]
MSNPETQYQPLVGTPSQTAVNVPAQGGRPSRAYKMAGLTLLACVLIVGQAMIAYFLLSQKGDIKSLQEQNNNLQSQLSKGRSVSAPMRMQMPMNALTELVDFSEEKDSSTGTPEKTEGTECQQEAAGIKPVPVPGYRPICDERGLYQPQQCFMGKCWCVNPASGLQIPGSLKRGPANCGVNFLIGGHNRVLTLPVADAEE